MSTEDKSGSTTLPDANGSASKAPLKVCIVGLKCYDHFAGKPIPRYVGGIETQLAVLAKGLRQEGNEVSVVTYDHGQADREVFDGVTLFKGPAPSGGIRGLRGFSRAVRLWSAMRRAGADVYLQMGAGGETGMTAFGCKWLPDRARFVFCLASDADCEGVLASGKFGVENQLYLFGIRRADLVVAQTETQKKNLKRFLGLDSSVIPMAVTAKNNPGKKRANSALWIGRLMPEKRFEWLLELARRCPEIEFHVAGTPNQPSAYAAKLLSTAATLPNVRPHGRLPQDELNRLFQECGFLCCTSTLEGFPTTFLEAWSCGLPVITTFDPDGIIARNGLGCLVKTLDELASRLRGLLSDDEARSSMSRAALKFFGEHYGVETVSCQFRRAFTELVAR